MRLCKAEACLKYVRDGGEYCDSHKRKFAAKVDYDAAQERVAERINGLLEKYGHREAETKATNPKDAIGMTKLPLHLIPGSAKAHLAIAFLEGALKYGKYNWRVAGVRSSIYLDAMERHLEKYKNGENSDPETGVHHLASVMACAAIILDAKECGKLTDDRPPMAPVSGLIDELAADVEFLKQLYENENPHQCTIEDSKDAHAREYGRVLPEVSRHPESKEAESYAEQGSPGSRKGGEGYEG